MSYNYGSSSQRSGQPSRNYDSSSQRAGPSSRNYDSSSQRAGPSSRNYDSSSQRAGPSSRNYDSSSRNHGSAPRNFNSGPRRGGNRKPPESKEEAEARIRSEKRKEVRNNIDEEKFSNEKLEVRRLFRGTVGDPISLLTNCFRLAVVGQQVFVYDVVMKAKQGKKHEGLDHLKRRDIFWHFYRENIFGSDQFSILFDDEHTAFTTKVILNLDEPKSFRTFKFRYSGDFGEYDIELTIRCKDVVTFSNLNGLQDGNNFTQLFQYVTQTAISQFWRMPEYWLAEQHKDYPDYSIWTAKGNRFIQTQLLFGQQPLGENFFAKLYGMQTADDMKMTVQNLNLRNPPPAIIGNLFKLYRGLVAGVHLGENGQAFVNFGVKHRVCANFDLPLIQYYAFNLKGKELSDENLIELSEFNISMNKPQKAQFNAECAGLYLKTICEPVLRCKFVELSDLHAKNFLPDRKGYNKLYNPEQVELMFPYLPLVIVKNFPYLIPIELLKVADTGIKTIDLRNRLIRTRICKAATLDPRAYRDKVSSLANQAILNYNPQMGAYKISVLDRSPDGDLKPIEVSARVLPVPDCQYTEDESPLEKEVLEAALPVTLIACSVNLDFFVNKDEYVQQLVETARGMGVKLENRNHVDCPDKEFNSKKGERSSPCHVDCPDKKFNSIGDVQRYVQKYKQQYCTTDNNVYRHRVLFLFIMGGLPTKSNARDVTTDMIYSWVKHVGDNLEGVPTQCINARKLEELSKSERELKSMTRNVVAKINTRLGGVMNEIRSDSESLCNEVFSRYTNEDSPSLFMGIFATKPPNFKKAVLTVSFNIDLKATRFAHIGVLANRENDFYEELTSVLLRVLTTFYQKIECLPANVFIFRGGLSNGVKDYVTQFELERFFEAWMQFEAKIKPRVPKPNVCYFVVDRAHNFRFFPKNNTGPKNDLNMPRGTVVDSGIVAPNYSKSLKLDTVKKMQGFAENQFILCSHRTKPESTVRPSCYSLTWCNENNIEPDPDDIQLLIFSLCFLVQRSVQSVANPAPLHYARLKADRMSYYLLTVESELTTHNNLELTNYVT